MKINYVVVLCVFHLKNNFVDPTNSTEKRPTGDDYYVNDYEYDAWNISSGNANYKSESLLLPDPENLGSKYAIDELPNFELPEDSLADTDLRDHDFIDNLMYVYYGSHAKKDSTFSPVTIIIIGSVLSCAAQLFTVFYVILQKQLSGNMNEMKSMFLHMMSTFCMSKLLFILCVYAMKNTQYCLPVAFVLHYLHVSSAFWVFLYSYYILKRSTSAEIVRYNSFILTGYISPVMFTLLSFLLAVDKFETKRFCFISIRRGMLLNYMVPVFLLIISTTIFSLYGLQQISARLEKLDFDESLHSLNSVGIKNRSYCENEEVAKKLKDTRICLKLLCGIQSGHDIVWFIVVLALDNDGENYMISYIYAVTACLLNWYIFYHTRSFLPKNSCDLFITEKSNGIPDEIKVDSSASSSTRGSSDNIPLLINIQGSTKMKELSVDFISTIST